MSSNKPKKKDQNQIVKKERTPITVMRVVKLSKPKKERKSE